MLESAFNKLLASFTDPVNMALLLVIGVLIWVRMSDKPIIDKLVETSGQQNVLLGKLTTSVDVITHTIVGDAKK